MYKVGFNGNSPWITSPRQFPQHEIPQANYTLGFCPPDNYSRIIAPYDIPQDNGLQAFAFRTITPK